MKRILITLALLSAHAWAAITAPTCVNNASTGVNTIIANQPSGLAVTAGDAIVVNAGQQSDSTTDNTITDGVNTYTPSGAGASPTDGGGATQKWSKAIAATTTTLNAITATFAAGATPTNSTIIACKIPGATTTEDGSVNTSGSGFIATLTSSAFSTTNSVDIILNSVRMSGTVSTPTADTGYTIPTNGTAGSRHSIEYKIVASTQSSVTALLSWTSTARASSSVMPLKGTAASTGTTEVSPFVISP